MRDAKFRRGAVLLCLVGAFTISDNAIAQTATGNDSGAIEEVIVTARKRDETAISVPVAVTALGFAQLNRLAVNNFDDVARLVPGLIVGEGGGTLQGGEITIRGIGGADANPFADQAVSFAIDGVQVSSAFVRRLAEMDMAQVEVLKGPQALFFGKNSPGGVISVRTADPTSDYEARLQTGYEFQAQEFRSEGDVSGPITDTLGARFSFFTSNIRGWVNNVAVQNAPTQLQPTHQYGPGDVEYAMRGTLKWDPTDNFSARAKLTFNRVTGDAVTWNDQNVACPYGSPHFGTQHECQANDVTETADLGPAYGKVNPEFGDGVGLLRQQQLLGSLELNYQPSDQISLTSVSGAYLVRFHGRANYTNDYQPNSILGSQASITNRIITEEVRVASSFNGPVNFLYGMFYQDQRAYEHTFTLCGEPGAGCKLGPLGPTIAAAPFYINNYQFVQNGQAWSTFGQIRWDVLDTVELSAGGRYSFEEKQVPDVEIASAAHPTLLTHITPSVDSGRWNNFSPEITATWRPDDKMTFYASYKRGFLSGGFNAGAPSGNGAALKYDQETIGGFEVGAKAALLDDHLRIDLAAFDYSIKGLQTTVTTANAVQLLTNAGKVAIKGFDANLTYRPDFLDGLTFSGGLEYLNGRYDNFLGQCYQGQTPALGCNINRNPATGAFTAQNLGGTQLVRAPRFTGNFGFDYETSLFDGFKGGVSSDVTFSSSYLTDTTSTPDGRQPAYETFDATFHFGADDDLWDVAVIGRNLTNTYYIVRSSDLPFTGSGAGTPGGIRDDTAAVVSRGQEIWLRATVEFK